MSESEVRAQANNKFGPGAKKDPFHFIPMRVLRGVGRVMRAGAWKYGFFNWRVTGVDCGTYHSAALRHLDEWFEGSNADTDDGEHPLDHVIACCLILRDADIHGVLEDNRPHVAASITPMRDLHGDEHAND